MAQIAPFTNFDPEMALTLGAAYDKAFARPLNQPDIVRETIAKRIVALAAKGERDVHALYDKALIAEGFLSWSLTAITLVPSGGRYGKGRRLPRICEAIFRVGSGGRQRGVAASVTGNGELLDRGRHADGELRR